MWLSLTASSVQYKPATFGIFPKPKARQLELGRGLFALVNQNVTLLTEPGIGSDQGLLIFPTRLPPGAPQIYASQRAAVDLRKSIKGQTAYGDASNHILYLSLRAAWPLASPLHAGHVGLVVTAHSGLALNRIGPFVFFC